MRRLIMFTAAASLLLFIVTLALWVRSYWRHQTIYYWRHQPMHHAGINYELYRLYLHLERRMGTLEYGGTIGAEVLPAVRVEIPV
jgi:hypothetical protein